MSEELVITTEPVDAVEHAQAYILLRDGKLVYCLTFEGRGGTKTPDDVEISRDEYLAVIAAIRVRQAERLNELLTVEDPTTGERDSVLSALVDIVGEGLNNIGLAVAES